MFFIISISIFLINQFLQYYGIGNHFTICFLDDLLFFPVSYSIIDYYFKIVNKGYIISIKFAIIGVIITSVIFEIILPLLSEKYTSDIYDIFFYILGGIIYMIFGQKYRTKFNLKKNIHYQ